MKRQPHPLELPTPENLERVREKLRAYELETVQLLAQRRTGLANRLAQVRAYEAAVEKDADVKEAKARGANEGPS